ncbi:dihydrodipicolinate synthase [[Clostridium] ultunense Esp]|uniref:4-hydroxy-tetrahydrodipicolinate synthase n=1 Tax=Thermicanus aegyptius TaxID=94009 RepID=UPI0002B6EF9E|nr:4-hydroxy-tetrahydrodipicolinate synthase [Thermicanus aegyptius]CCQ98095.1 dihydrodipicolinate synthase [[Clostridium] ultunense Esp]
MDFGRLLTAMVTPFDEELEINWPQVDRLVDHLIATGTEAIVVAGTTGESPTLTKEEKLELYRRVKERAHGKALTIAGTGGNNTKESIALTKKAEEIGVDGVMLVVPYYNKPSQEGLYRHFKAIAEETSLPIMLYNIPGRSGINMNADTVLRLSLLPNIRAVKEASGNLSQVAKIIEGTPEDFLLYSGDDSMLLPILSIGGHGVVSVASHVIGNEIRRMINAFFAGDVQEAARLHRKNLKIFEGLFFTSSPAPVKAALELKGFHVGGLRLPLVSLSEEERERVKGFLQD